jgi:hypothetical protein
MDDGTPSCRRSNAFPTDAPSKEGHGGGAGMAFTADLWQLKTIDAQSGGVLGRRQRGGT